MLIRERMRMPRTDSQHSHVIRIVRVAAIILMKKDIHPKYFKNAKIICACGNVITTGSTVPEMKVEICSACHPFYTGKRKILDATGRVERFKRMTEEAAKKQAAKPKKKEKAIKTKAEIKKTVSKKKTK